MSRTREELAVAVVLHGLVNDTDEVPVDLADDRRHGTRVLYMSGGFTERTPKKLPKPFSEPELLEAVAAVLAADPS